MIHPGYSKIERRYERLLRRPNAPAEQSNGVLTRWRSPVLTARHVPPFWKIDVRLETNPFLMERMGVSAITGAGVLKVGCRILLCASVAGDGGQSFFAVAESCCPTEGFRFWDKPAALPELGAGDSNAGDLRLTRHQDGWVYGVCRSGIVRTKDLKAWECLPDSIAKEMQPSPRDGTALFPRFINGRFAFSAAPGAVPIRTPRGWIHIVSKNRAICAFATDLDEPRRVIAEPGGCLLMPEGGERAGNIGNMLTVCGAVDDADGNVYIYYASAGTRLHVASTTADRLADYVFSAPSGNGRAGLIERNLSVLKPS
jgi:4-O-beta-D-mannosyl-D-glucose phosphorylase